MALPTSGTITLDMIRDEMGVTGEFSLFQAAFLAGMNPTIGDTISMSDFYGYRH